MKKLVGRLASRVGGALDRVILSTLSSGFAGRRAASARAAAASAHAPDRRALLAAAIEFYGHPDTAARLFRAPPPLARVVEERRGRLEGGAFYDLKWSSEYEPAWETVRADYLAHEPNRFGHARLFQHDAPAPTLMCLHGYRAGNYFIEEWAFAARWLYRIGLNVVLFQLPFHARRGGPNAPIWPSVNVGRTNEGFAQAIFDLRALAGWVRARVGEPRVAVSGMSLGGYTTALYATVEEPAFAAPMIPVASFPDLLWAHGAGRPERARAEREGITLDMLRQSMAVHTPLERAPKVRGERVLVVSAEGDQIAPCEHAARLAAHFECEELRFAGGHVLQLGRGGAFRALARRMAALELLPPRR